MRYCALFATFLMVSFANAEDKAEDKPAVRKLDLKDVKLKHEAKEPQSAEITSADALSKSKLFADDASRDLVKKQVDFAKEKLIVSAWNAPVGGWYTTEIEGGEILTVSFVYQAGEKAGVKDYGAVYIVPKNAKILRVVQIE